mmetsp:Transcript_21190/g.53394  ORF Transcript_21190/g.53394 Transcript_21190/m.53394 type:complete len:719 (+) Transcript_21190:124-2280(+)
MLLALEIEQVRLAAPDCYTVLLVVRRGTSNINPAEDFENAGEEIFVCSQDFGGGAAPLSRAGEDAHDRVAPEELCGTASGRAGATALEVERAAQYRRPTLLPEFRPRVVYIPREEQFAEQAKGGAGTSSPASDPYSSLLQLEIVLVPSATSGLQDVVDDTARTSAQVEQEELTQDIDRNHSRWLDFARGYDRGRAIAFSWNVNLLSGANDTASWRKTFTCPRRVQSFSVHLYPVKSARVLTYFVERRHEDFVRALHAREFGDLFHASERDEQLQEPARTACEPTFLTQETANHPAEEEVGRGRRVGVDVVDAFGEDVLRNRVELRLPGMAAKTLHNQELAKAALPFTIPVSSLRRIRKTPRVRDLYRQLEQRNSKKRDDIEQIVLKLHHGRISLDALQDEKRRLEKSQKSLLDTNSRLEKKVAQTVFPDLTEVDVDLYFAGANNPHDLYLILQCADARYQQTRKNLVTLWNSWKKVEQILHASRSTPAQITHVAEVLGELKGRVRAEYRKGGKEYERLKELVQGQDVLVRQLQDRIKRIEKGGGLASGDRGGSFFPERETEGRGLGVTEGEGGTASGMPVIDQIELLKLRAEAASLQTLLEKTAARDIKDKLGGGKNRDHEEELLTELSRVQEDVALGGERVRAMVAEIRQKAERDEGRKAVAEVDLEFHRFREQMLRCQEAALAAEIEAAERGAEREKYRLELLLSEKDAKLRALEQ